MKRLDYSTQFISQDDIDGVIEVLNSQCLAQGKKVAEFEQALCDYTGAKHAIAFNSATSALFGAYSACGISKDDEIITTPISFVSTSNMFVELGAKPIWCDVKEDGNINEELIEALITDKTKAIVPVHFAGKPVDLEKIHNIAKKYNLLVIEDAAHALGSAINDKKIGSLSDMTIFSFHAIKPITTSEGGAVLTNNDSFAKRLRLIRSHGIIKKELWNSDMQSMGYNFRMTEVAGSLGCTQMKKLDSFVVSRDIIANYYDEMFAKTELVSTTAIEYKLKSARHLYPLFLSTKLLSKKELIFQELQKQGLGVQVHYRPIYQNSFYIKKFGEYFLENSEQFYKSEISIPCHQQMSLDDAKYVVQTVLNILKSHTQ